MHRPDDGHVIDTVRDVREQRADLSAALAMRSELPLRPLQKDAFITGTVLDLRVVRLDLFSVAAGQFWFWIEQCRRAKRQS